MNTKPTRIPFLLAPISISLPPLAGCNRESAEGSDLGTASQAFGETSCADNGIADKSFTGTGSITSPTTYSNNECFKAYITDVSDLALNNSGAVTVSWTDTLPTNQTDCENLWLSADVYLQILGNWAILNPQARSSHGTWGPDFPGGTSFCTGPGAEWTNEGLTSGASYRFSVTARTSDTSDAPTRSFVLRTQGPLDGGS